MTNNIFQKTLVFRILLLGIAVAFITIGIMRGDALAVFRKAVFICMECIGIG